MRIVIKDLCLRYDFPEIFEVCKNLLTLYSLDSVTFHFNGTKCTIYQDTGYDEAFKLYRNKVK